MINKKNIEQAIIDHQSISTLLAEVVKNDQSGFTVDTALSAVVIKTLIRLVDSKVHQPTYSDVRAAIRSFAPESTPSQGTVKRVRDIMIAGNNILSYAGAPPAKKTNLIEYIVRTRIADKALALYEEQGASCVSGLYKLMRQYLAAPLRLYLQNQESISSGVGPVVPHTLMKGADSTMEAICLYCDDRGADRSYHDIATLTHVRVGSSPSNKRIKEINDFIVHLEIHDEMHADIMSGLVASIVGHVLPLSCGLDIGGAEKKSLFVRLATEYLLVAGKQSVSKVFFK